MPSSEKLPRLNGVPTGGGPPVFTICQKLGLVVSPLIVKLVTTLPAVNWKNAASNALLSKNPPFVKWKSNVRAELFPVMSTVPKDGLNVVQLPPPQLRFS